MQPARTTPKPASLGSNWLGWGKPMQRTRSPGWISYFSRSASEASRSMGRRPEHHVGGRRDRQDGHVGGGVLLPEDLPVLADSGASREPSRSCRRAFLLVEDDRDLVALRPAQDVLGRDQQELGGLGILRHGRLRTNAVPEASGSDSLTVASISCVSRSLGLGPQARAPAKASENERLAGGDGRRRERASWPRPSLPGCARR